MFSENYTAVHKAWRASRKALVDAVKRGDAKDMRMHARPYTIYCDTVIGYVRRFGTQEEKDHCDDKYHEYNCEVTLAYRDYIESGNATMAAFNYPHQAITALIDVLKDLQGWVKEELSELALEVKENGDLDDGPYGDYLSAVMKADDDYCDFLDSLTDDEAIKLLNTEFEFTRIV